MLSDIHTCSWYYWQNGKVWHLLWQALTVDLNYRSFVLSLYNLPRLAYAIWKFCLFFVTLCYYAICKLCLYFICNCKITRSESWELVGNGGTIVDFLRVKKLFSIISLRYIVRYDQWCKKFHEDFSTLFWLNYPKALTDENFTLSAGVCTKARKTSLLHLPTETKSVTSDGND